MTWKRRLEPRLRPLYQMLMRQTRGLTLGVRGLVTDPDGRVLLVEHTYVHGWYLPGGGVERRETAEAAVIRELREEAGVRVVAPPRLLSIHSNERTYRGDHVLFYRCEAWEPCEASAQGEIARIGWFAPDDLPEGTRPGHRRRIEEVFAARAPDVLW